MTPRSLAAALVLSLVSISPVARAQSNPPAPSSSEYPGAPLNRCVSTTRNYVSNDVGITWIPMPSIAGGGGGTSSTFGLAFPATGTAAGFTDGVNMRGAKVFDADTGIGTDYVQGMQLRRSASGGSVEIGVAGSPLYVAPDTTFACTQSGSWTGVGVTGTFWPTTAAAPGSTRLSDGAAFYDAAKTGQLPSALVGGRLDENAGAWLGSTAPTVGQKAMASSLPVTIASDQASIPVAATAPALTKGTQGANGFSTQDLKDAGRSVVYLQIDNIAAVAAEALISYGGWKGGAALTGGTGAYTVTANKTFRMTSLTVTGSGSAAATMRCRVRALLTTVVVGSPAYAAAGIVIPAASGGGTDAKTFADGIEIPAGFQIGISCLGATTNTYSVFVTGFEY